MARNVAIIVMVVVMTGDGGGGAACGLETYVAIVKDVRQDRVSKEDEEARNRKRIRGRAGRERIMYPRLQPGRGNRLWVGICVMRTLACPALRVVPLFFFGGLSRCRCGIA